MVVQEIVRKSTEFFQKKGFSSPRLDAELLIAEALGWRRLDLFLKFDFPLGEVEIEKCRQLVARRGKGEPVAYIRGRKEFYKKDFIVGPGVLIPRPETEAIVELGVEYAKKRQLEKIRVVDLGFGSGCIGLSLCAELPGASLVGVEREAPAIQIARKNIENLNLESRVQVIHEDVCKLELGRIKDLLGGSPDLVVANPPYIAVEDPMVESMVKEFEPAAALFAGDGGLAEIRAWSEIAEKMLEGSGLFLCEIGATQGETVLDFVKAHLGFRDQQIRKDDSGHDRILIASK